MPEMKLSLMTGILLIIIGLTTIVVSIASAPFINSEIDKLHSNLSNLFQNANRSIIVAQQTVNSTETTLIIARDSVNVSLPSLVSSSQLVNSIASNLTAISSTVSGVGQTMSDVSVLGVSPFVSVGTTISSLGPPIRRHKPSKCI